MSEATMEMEQPKSVSQSMDDDECGSFIVVRHWTSSSPNNEDNPSMIDEVDGESDEQFSDAAAELGSSETLANSLPEGSAEEMSKSVPEPAAIETFDVTQSTSFVEQGMNAPLIPMSQSQESEGNFMMDEERFSMTNYSTASSSSEQQLEEVQTKLSRVINDHKGLLELLEKQNMELEIRKTTIEELKLLANESVAREKEKSEDSRRIVEKAMLEKDAAVQKLETVSSAQANNAQQNVHGFDNIQILERQLRQRDHIIQQNGEQIRELSNRLHQEIVKSEEVMQLLRIKQEEDKVKNDSLSSSDEALAKSLCEKEGLEQQLQELDQVKRELQQEIANMKERLDVATSDNIRFQNLGEKLDAKCAVLDNENQTMQIKLAALEAEKEHQMDMFKQQASRVDQLQEEKSQLQRDLGRVNEMLQARTSELATLQTQGSQMSGSASGNLFGFLKNTVNKPARSFGFRDLNDDPNEPFQQESFDHVGGQAPLQPTPAPAPVQEEGMQCPICLKRFNEMRKLQYHASACGVDNALNSDPFVFP